MCCAPLQAALEGVAVFVLNTWQPPLWLLESLPSNEAESSLQNVTVSDMYLYIL